MGLAVGNLETSSGILAGGESREPEWHWEMTEGTLELFLPSRTAVYVECVMSTSARLEAAAVAVTHTSQMTSEDVTCLDSGHKGRKWGSWDSNSKLGFRTGHLATLAKPI